MDAERRRAKRGRLDLRVRYHVPGNAARGATLQDISAYGLFVVGGEALAPGTRMVVEFDDPAGRRHEVEGEVLRSHPKGGFAVSFVRVDDATVEFIRDALEDR